MTDKLIAVLALLTFIAFLAVVVVWVPDIDMIVVFAFVSILAAYDFWRMLRSSDNRRT